MFRLPSLTCAPPPTASRIFFCRKKNHGGGARGVCRRHTPRDARKKKRTRMYRPLSPHIFIYKPQVTSILSVLHRTTGIILAVMLVVGIIGIKLTMSYITQYPIYYVAASLCTLETPWLAAVILGILVLT